MKLGRLEIKAQRWPWQKTMIGVVWLSALRRLTGLDRETAARASEPDGTTSSGFRLAVELYCSICSLG